MICGDATVQNGGNTSAIKPIAQKVIPCQEIMFIGMLKKMPAIAEHAEKILIANVNLCSVWVEPQYPRNCPRSRCGRRIANEFYLGVHILAHQEILNPAVY
jgi:hypothetical protein